MSVQSCMLHIWSPCTCKPLKIYLNAIYHVYDTKEYVQPSWAYVQTLIAGSSKHVLPRGKSPTEPTQLSLANVRNAKMQKPKSLCPLRNLYSQRAILANNGHVFLEGCLGLKQRDSERVH